MGTSKMVIIFVSLIRIYSEKVWGYFPYFSCGIFKISSPHREQGNRQIEILIYGWNRQLFIERAVKEIVDALVMARKNISPKWIPLIAELWKSSSRSVISLLVKKLHFNKIRLFPLFWTKWPKIVFFSKQTNFSEL